jgi:hypothetical protein
MLRCPDLTPFRDRARWDSSMRRRSHRRSTELAPERFGRYASSDRADQGI